MGQVTPSGTEADLLRTLEKGIGDREFLVGDHFTTADLMVASYLAFYLQFKMLDPRPTFRRFAELHRTRPAARRADEIDEAIIAKQKQKQKTGA